MTRKRVVLISLCAAAVLVATLVVVLRSKPETLYRVTFVPTRGDASFGVHAINDRGQVVGIEQVKQNEWHMFLWDKDGGMRDLGSCADPRRFEYVQINNAGQIAGTTVDPNGDGHAFLRDPNGLRHILRAPGGEQVYICGLNDRGQVVGYHTAERGPRRAFVWDKAAGMKDLGAPDMLESLARSINDAGQVVGYLSVDRTNDRYAFLWDPNTAMQSLGRVCSLPTAACHINNQGLVVGQFGSAEDRTCLSMWTREGGVRRVDSHGAAMYVAGVDDAGRFVARAYRSGFKAFGYDSVDRRTSYLWDPNDGFREIHRHLGRRDVVEFVAVDMNNNGQILGLLSLKNHPDPIGVVLEPVK